VDVDKESILRCSMELDNLARCEDAWPNLFSDAAASLRIQQQRIEELEGALRVAREAIQQAPQDAFGSVGPAHDHPGYFIQDELVDRLTKALAAAEGK